MWWKKGRLTKAFIVSRNGGICKLRTTTAMIVKGVSAKAVTVKYFSRDQYLNSFETVAGKKYELNVK
jgi:alpha-L-fucosidase 2